MPPEILEKFIKFCGRPEVFEQLIREEKEEETA